MNDDDRNGQLPITEADTTPPNPANAIPLPNSEWQMPEPKFQQTSGYLPQGYIDQLNIGQPGAASAAAPAPEPVTLPDVEPQPDLSEQIGVEPVPVAPPPPVKERSTGARVVMVVLGLLGMVAFIAVFLGAVYYLFLARGGEGSQF